jgi:hypothetical protein
MTLGEDGLPQKSRKMLAEYRREHPKDELESVLNAIGDERWIRHRDANPTALDLELHHVLRRGMSSKWDRWHNSLMARQRAHIWCHDHSPIGGMVAAMFAKASTVAADELPDVRWQWRVSFGRDALDGVSAYLMGGRVPEPYVEYAKQLLEMF